MTAMSRAMKTAAVVAALAVGGAITAIGGAALGDDDPLPSPVTVAAPAAHAVDTDDRPLSRREASRASRAALRVTGGGTVTELDRYDD